MSPPLPNFLIVGAMKSGTTSLANWIARHPQGYLAPGKEIHFFDVDEKWELGLDWYRGFFAGADGAAAVGEGTPRYMFLARAVERMAATVPDAKLIVGLRDPVGRAVSHWQHACYRAGRERRSFEESVRHELTLPVDFECESINGAYLARGYYARQLERLERHYPRERIHVLLFEDMQADAAGVFAGVCEFLGIDAVHPPNLGSRDNAAGGYRPLWLWRRLQHRRRIQRWHPRVAGPIERAMKAPLPRQAPLDPALQTLLVEHFEPHTAALEQWLGRPVEGWKRPQRAAA